MAQDLSWERAAAKYEDVMLGAKVRWLPIAKGATHNTHTHHGETCGRPLCFASALRPPRSRRSRSTLGDRALSESREASRRASPPNKGALCAGTTRPCALRDCCL